MSAHAFAWRRILPPIALIAAAVLVAPTALADAKRDVATKSIPVGKLQRVAIDFPVGDLEVLGTDGREIRLEVELRCDDHDDCDDIAEDVRVTSATHGDELRLEVEGPRWRSQYSFRGRIEIPRSMRVEIEMSGGELEIDGLEKDLDVHVSVGDVDVSLSEAAVRSVDMNVSIGEASLQPRAGSSMRGWLGKEIEWDAGKGSSRVDINVSIGEVTVRLR